MSLNLADGKSVKSCVANCMECPQYSIRLEAISYLYAGCIRSTQPKIQRLVSRDSIVDRQFVTAMGDRVSD